MLACRAFIDRRNVVKNIKMCFLEMKIMSFRNGVLLI